MKKLLFSAVFILFQIHTATAGEIAIEGTFKGKNIFVYDSLPDDGTFCTIAIYVNGEKVADEPSTESFEINLKQMGLEIGDPIKIVIVHQDGCKPTVRLDPVYIPVQE
jgi:hypothetical protein